MTLNELLGVYKCYNDIVLIDVNTREEVLCDKVIFGEQKDEYLNATIKGIRAIPSQNHENAYFQLENELRLMIGVKVNVLVEK